MYEEGVSREGWIRKNQKQVWNSCCREHERADERIAEVHAETVRREPLSSDDGHSCEHLTSRTSGPGEGGRTGACVASTLENAKLLSAESQRDKMFEQHVNGEMDSGTQALEGSRRSQEKTESLREKRESLGQPF